MDQESVRPALELGGVLESADVSPDVEERLLGRILGQVRVAQDAVGQAEQARVVGDGQRFERTLVTLLSPYHEVLVHTLTLAGPSQS